MTVRALVAGALAGAILLAALPAAELGSQEATAPERAVIEKLILGFEKEQLARGQWIAPEVKTGRDCWFYLLDQPEGFDFAARFEWPGSTNRLWTWNCRPGEHTEGELALVSSAGKPNPYNRPPTFKQTEFLSHFYPALRSSFGAHLLMTTFQWSVKARPDLWDWSGYDLLRIDVRAHQKPVKISFALEDDIIEPPVLRTFEVPADKWVTLELDLEEAVRARELDLKNIRNFWLLGNAPERTELRIDNIRITKKGARAPKAVLRDESTMSVSIPRPERPLRPSLPADLKPDRSPLKLTEPVTVAKGSVTPFGWVAAYDNKRIFIAYNTGNTTTAATYTDDGGRTWKELPPATAHNLDHGTARGCAIDVQGDGAAVSTGPGCCGFLASSKQHLTKYPFTGSGWQARLPARILDSDIRHCGHNASMVRLTRGPYKGRLWASWGEIDREHAVGVHVKFSDDDGETWVPWGKGALLPGSRLGQWSDGTYNYPDTVVTPYRDHVACIWWHPLTAGGKVMWSVYDGSAWSPPGEVTSAIPLDSAFRAVLSAVTLGEDQVLFTATGLTSVLRWDSKGWVAEPVTCEGDGMLSLAGDVVTLFTSEIGKVNRLWKNWKGRSYSRPALLRSYRRSPQGEWEGPVTLTPEFTIHEYRGIPGFYVPPYSPPNFIPLAWSDHDQGTVKLLKVPVSSER